MRKIKGIWQDFYVAAGMEALVDKNMTSSSEEKRAEAKESGGKANKKVNGLFSNILEQQGSSNQSNPTKPITGPLHQSSLFW